MTLVCLKFLIFGGRTVDAWPEPTYEEKIRVPSPPPPRDSGPHVLDEVLSRVLFACSTPIVQDQDLDLQFIAIYTQSRLSVST